MGGCCSDFLCSSSSNKVQDVDFMKKKIVTDQHIFTIKAPESKEQYNWGYTGEYGYFDQ